MSNRTLDIRAKFPAKLDFLFQPARYKVLHGGRGGAKSWGIARALLIEGSKRPLRVICCREIQKSIAESVHALLREQIDQLGLSAVYRITDTYIEGIGAENAGTLFTFHGLKHNISSIKSLEGVDICWVEEAQVVSKTSWEVLIPTIRKEGSEIWVSFNPELESDDTYQRFVSNPPSGAKVQEIGYQDNPWLPDVLRKEMEDLKEKDPDAWLHVWAGKCRATLTGAVYANELRAVSLDGRETRVPYDPSIPVHVIFDLGRSDMTAIWFLQIAGYEFRFIDYYENSGFAFSHYLKVLTEKPYHWGTWWLPHDAEHKTIAAERSVKEQALATHKDVQIVPHLGTNAVYLGIDMARNIFPRCVFDKEKCSDGLHALKHYVYKVTDDGRRSNEPLHNWASHGSDAFRYTAVAVKQPRSKIEKPKVPAAQGGPGAWMA